MPVDANTRIPADMLAAAQSIWLAGLGAIAVAQQEGGKLFSTLVEKGAELEKAGFSPAAAVDAVKDAAGNASDEFEHAWKSVPRFVDEQVTAALHRIGVPTRDEIAALMTRIDQLTLAIEQLKSRTR